MTRTLLLLPLLLAACAAPSGYPVAATTDPCHVGNGIYCAVNPEVTQATLAQTICKPGWDVQHRAAANREVNFAREKRAALALAHLQHPDWTLANTEWDHRLAGGMGGSWSDSSNLSLEFGDEPHPGDTTHNRKDDEETRYHTAICSGQIGLRQAQAEFTAKWLGSWPGYKA